MEPTADDLPPTLSLGALLSELAAGLQRAVERLRAAPNNELRDLADDPVATVAGLARSLGVDWPGSPEEVTDFARSRMSGDYAIDEFGFDPEFTTKIFLPLLRPLVQSWFRVEVRGTENLPADGSALLVSNHAGTMPLDGMVLHAVVYDEIERHIRMLGADLIFKTPFSAMTWPARSAPRWPARRMPNGCSPPTSWSRCSRRASRAWASCTRTATSCSGSAAAVSCPRRSALRCR